MKKKAVTKEMYLAKPKQTEETQEKEVECAYNLAALDPESLDYALKDLSGKLDAFQFSHSSLLKIRDAIRQVRDSCKQYGQEYEKPLEEAVRITGTVDVILTVVYPDPIEVEHPLPAIHEHV